MLLVTRNSNQNILAGIIQMGEVYLFFSLEKVMLSFEF
jgi:hypothetical protein